MSSYGEDDFESAPEPSPMRSPVRYGASPYGDDDFESAPEPSPANNDDDGWGMGGGSDASRSASDESSVWSAPPTPSSAGSGPAAAVPWRPPSSSESEAYSSFASESDDAPGAPATPAPASESSDEDYDESFEAAESEARPPPEEAGWEVMARVAARAAQESEIPNFKGSDLGHFPLVSADSWTSDHLSERSRSVGAVSETRARGTLTLKRR